MRNKTRSAQKKPKHGDTREVIDSESPIIERRYERTRSDTPFLDRLKGLAKALRSLGVETISDHLVGSTKYDLVEYRYERVRTDVFQSEYYSHPDGGIGRHDGWVRGNWVKGAQISRKVKSTDYHRNLSGSPVYVP